ncbi:Ger(x)C family spore germination protein [Clostridium botulinum C]|uniref:Ger(X)C family spore germination protein n=2 Tax=Clostridium botulinum TaxID=1491 RepID=A0A9Q4XV89_CLOBO|nr:Ger(x)C family spore germination protein [Clostridium botulinum]MCD3194981.1 Ger(x)C family spore germination protein [Clostridium botulinum C]MCD3200780.1 Ger(x)C family spore germination protein [Clostridium botulinum C]MCD3206188.1 Ger(x)C family spore germination protein [Clostridium botulinum C]MCD3208386.1 Ger(x)C family spore germination protein [Clostridium botulinum C]MCD3225916.1 Ger(x)C family spore germination protein [Clostridium botulinum C]
MRYKKLTILMLLCCFLTGCWDKVEIERKSFISTIAIDPGKSISKQNELKKIRSNEIFNESQYKKINVTFGFPNISELGPNNSGTAKEQTVTTNAFSMQDSINELASKTSRTIYTGHSKLILLSNDIMQYPDIVKEVFDFFERQADIDRMTLVIVVNGKAEDYVKFIPTMEKNIETYISGLMENGSMNSTILPVTLNDVLISLYKDGSVAIPSIEFDKEDKTKLNVSGLSLIKNYKLQGYLTPDETSSLDILRGKVKGGKETILKDGHPIELQIEGMKRKLGIVDASDIEKLKFKVDINLEGQLKGYYIGENMFSYGKLNDIQQDFNEVIERKCEKVARIIQEQHNIDLIGLKDYVKKFYPDIYKRVKDNWEKVYKNSNIDVSVNVKARRVGISK